jgi:hypothetical protein
MISINIPDMRIPFGKRYENLPRSLGDKTQREVVIESFKADREVRMRKPLGRRAKGMQTFLLH